MGERNKRRFLSPCHQLGLATEVPKCFYSQEWESRVCCAWGWAISAMELKAEPRGVGSKWSCRVWLSQENAPFLGLCCSACNIQAQPWVCRGKGFKDHVKEMASGKSISKRCSSCNFIMFSRCVKHLTEEVGKYPSRLPNINIGCAESMQMCMLYNCILC